MVVVEKNADFEKRICKLELIRGEGKEVCTSKHCVTKVFVDVLKLYASSGI